MELSAKQLERLLQSLETAGVAEFEYKDDKYSLRLALGRAAPFAAPAVMEVTAPAAPAALQAQSAEDASVAFITSPFVGTFYRAPAPEADPFVDVGARVSKGQPLCIVEAMKLMNEIECEFSGIVAEILVENGAVVEYGQRLFKIKKA